LLLKLDRVKYNSLSEGSRSSVCGPFPSSRYGRGEQSERLVKRTASKSAVSRVISGGHQPYLHQTIVERMRGFFAQGNLRSLWKGKVPQRSCLKESGAGN